MMETIDLRVVWAGALPALLAVHADGSPSGRAIAVEELKRMADAADFAQDFSRALEAVLTVFERSAPMAGHWMEFQHAKAMLGKIPARQDTKF